jgi:hypothetical protein
VQVGQVVFANTAEQACAELLGFYGVAWQYEPCTFPLRRDEQGRVLEAFTPDFYLPQLGVFLEVTTMRQAHVSRKQRKLRRFRERYPQHRVLLFGRRDIERLVTCHGVVIGDAA